VKTPKGYNPYSAETEKAKCERNKLAFKKWDDFIKSCSESDVYDRIELFFKNHAEETLGINVVSELTRMAAEGKARDYMLLLRSNLSNLDWFSRNFFYLQWIRMSAITLLTIDERGLIDTIPVVPAPNSTESYAVTMKNKNGSLVMISFEFSRLMLSVFKIIARESTRGEIDEESRKTSDLNAATKILNIIKTIHNDLEVPLNHNPENYTDQQIHHADYLNNQFHCFVLLHEYSHILLNHIDPLNVDLTKPLTKVECTSLFKNASWEEVGFRKNGMELPLEKSNRFKDLEADKKAASLLAKPNLSKSDGMSNTVLTSSIYVYHYLQMISKAILGFSEESFESNLERLNAIIAFIHKDEPTIPLLRERHILEIALTKALSE
jgi:hypothetical protein